MTLVKSILIHNLFAHEPVFAKHARNLTEYINLSIDSRALVKNSIFFAIKGEFADGHDYIDSAFAQGALIVIANKNYALKEKYKHKDIIWVDDPLAVFSRLAHNYLQTLSVKKIALTGSNGKTTTKEMIKSAFMSVCGVERVYASAGNRNNHFGVPLSAFEVKAEHHIAIFEMGMNSPGEITQLCEIINPDFGLITNISNAHEGQFADGIDGVQRAKGELFAAIKNNNSHAIINLDDIRIRAESQKYSLNSCTSFGWSKEADIRIKSREAYNLESQQQKIIIQSMQREYIISCPIPGAHQAYNAAAALACIHALALPIEKAALGISTMTLTPGRLSLNKHKKGFLIINDGYNANPGSMKSGIDAVLELPAQRRIAVVGAMGELGKHSDKFHFELGKLLAGYFDHVFICGEDAHQVVLGAQYAGKKSEHLFFASSSEHLIEPLKALIKTGDAVFIKGSLSANMAVVAQALALF